MFTKAGALRRNFAITSCLTGLLVLNFSFQNCSETKFSDIAQSDSKTASGQQIATEEPTTTICNPLDPTAPCAVQGEGLVGDVYYLVSSQASLFGDDLRNAKLQDYRTFGTRVDAQISMRNIDVSTRSWSAGFQLPDGRLVESSPNQTLNEWFHLDIRGQIQLPPGRYQLATVSDDGIRITVNNQVVINNDDIHPPTFDCGSPLIEFTEGERQDIRVEYFQGPRVQIALQLFFRPEVETSRACEQSEGFSVVPEHAFSL